MKKLISLLLIAGLAFASWTYTGSWTIPGTLDGRPHGLATAPNGNIYVADFRDNNIQYYTPAGSFLGSFNSNFFLPHDVTVSPGGIVYVADTFNGKIKYFTLNGSLLGSWGNPDLNRPYGVGVNYNGNVYVADSGRVIYFNATGEYLGEWGGLSNPTDVCIFNNRVGISDTSAGSLRIYTTSGSLINMVTGLIQPTGVALNKDLIYVSEESAHKISWYTLSGIKQGELLAKFQYPCGIAFSGGKMYVADTYNNQIKYFTYSPDAVLPSSLGKVKAAYK